MRHYIVRKLSTHRSRLRVYLDIRSLAEAGFHPGQQYSRHLDATRKALRLPSSTPKCRFRIFGEAASM